jgi:hypothetical protein
MRSDRTEGSVDAMQSRIDTTAYARPSRSQLPDALVWSLVLLFFSSGAAAVGVFAEADTAFVPKHDPKRLQTIVDDLRGRLTLPHAVRVTLVRENALMVSVQSVDGLGNEFELSVEDGFIDQLTDDELEAVLAHELGHVWIFTHHPYLQTEALANQIARRIVARDVLVRVYEKVWKIKGTKGDLARFIGD